MLLELFIFVTILEFLRIANLNIKLVFGVDVGFNGDQ